MRKSKISPEKLVTSLAATKLYTVVEPLGPLYSFQLTPEIVGVEMGEPVLDIGPAPPMAASQIMISYSFEPLAEDEVKRSL